VDPEKEESEVKQTILADSPMVGLASEVMPESNSNLQDTQTCDITLDPEKEESEVNQTTLTDSPIMGLVSEVISESHTDLQDAPPCDITLDAQDALPCDITLDAQDALPCDITLDAQDAPPCDITLDAQDAPPCDITLAVQDAPPCDITLDVTDAPSDLCLSSPVRAPVDAGIEKMLDSVVRHFARASIKDSAKKIDATDKIISDDAAELAQNENAVKEKVDLRSMSLRKLKAMYKDHLIELNSKKVTSFNLNIYCWYIGR
jgi:hypothetical protein